VGEIQGTATIAITDYAGLRHFIGCYFHDDIHGTLEAVVKDFLERAEPTTLAQVRADLDLLINSNEDAPSIFDWLVRIHCNGYVNKANPREQLGQFHDLLRKGIEKRGRVS
jgi:hypothetical protein